MPSIYHPSLNCLLGYQPNEQPGKHGCEWVGWWHSYNTCLADLRLLHYELNEGESEGHWDLSRGRKGLRFSSFRQLFFIKLDSLRWKIVAIVNKVLVHEEDRSRGVKCP